MGLVELSRLAVKLFTYQSPRIFAIPFHIILESSRTESNQKKFAAFESAWRPA